MGAEVHRGDLADLTGLRKAAADADAVIHLAFDHATMSAGDFPGAVATDMAVVQALGDALAGTGKTLVGVGLTHTGDARRDAAIDANHWPAGHVLDIGRLYRLVLDKAPAGAQLYGEAEQGITVREIAETIGRRLDLPAVSIPAEQATGHFGPFGAIMTMGLPPLSSDATRELLGWKPEHPGLLADLEEGHYFAR